MTEEHLPKITKELSIYLSSIDTKNIYEIKEKLKDSLNKINKIIDNQEHESFIKWLKNADYWVNKKTNEKVKIETVCWKYGYIDFSYLSGGDRLDRILIDTFKYDFIPVINIYVLETDES